MDLPRQDAQQSHHLAYSDQAMTSTRADFAGIPPRARALPSPNNQTATALVKGGAHTSRPARQIPGLIRAYARLTQSASQQEQDGGAARHKSTRIALPDSEP
jgi:hypothetical protein